MSDSYYWQGQSSYWQNQSNNFEMQLNSMRIDRNYHENGRENALNDYNQLFSECEARVIKYNNLVAKHNRLCESHDKLSLAGTNLKVEINNLNVDIKNFNAQKKRELTVLQNANIEKDNEIKRLKNVVVEKDNELRDLKESKKATDDELTDVLDLAIEAQMVYREAMMSSYDYFHQLTHLIESLNNNVDIEISAAILRQTAAAFFLTVRLDGARGDSNGIDINDKSRTVKVGYNTIKDKPTIIVDSNDGGIFSQRIEDQLDSHPLATRITKDTLFHYLPQTQDQKDQLELMVRNHFLNMRATLRKKELPQADNTIKTTSTQLSTLLDQPAQEDQLPSAEAHAPEETLQAEDGIGSVELPLTDEQPAKPEQPTHLDGDSDHGDSPNGH